MKKINIGLIGAGNIIETRHLPALAVAKNRFNILGIIDQKQEKAERLARKFKIPNWTACQDVKDLSSIKWMEDVDATIIATPPMQHAELIQACLELGKHVLVEKPFVLDIEDGKAIVDYALRRQLALAVNHNFQFSRSFCRCSRLIADGKLGDVQGFYCVQFSGSLRRLPIWAEDLPLGLFYDESPHAFYLLRKFGGEELTINNVFCVPSASNKNTPRTIDISIDANGIPSTIYCNFESPISEWDFIVFGTKYIAIIDMFRDIIITLPNDGQHLMNEVFASSFLSTVQHWLGFIHSGYNYIRNRLHYGIDITQARFHTAITTGDTNILENMAGSDGLAVNKAQHAVIKMSNLNGD